MARAEQELAAITDHIRLESGEARAEAVARRIISTLDTFADFPDAGRRYAGLPGNARTLTVEPWLVVYRILATDLIRVDRIIDGRRDLSDIL